MLHFIVNQYWGAQQPHEKLAEGEYEETSDNQASQAAEERENQSQG